MLGRLFWIGVGAGAGLWGRQRAIDAVDKHVPKAVQRTVKHVAVDRVKRFADEVRDAERRKKLEAELEELRAREEERKGPGPEDI